MRPQRKQIENDRLVDVNEAASILSVSPKTLYDWAYERRLPAVDACAANSSGVLRADVEIFGIDIVEAHFPRRRIALYPGRSVKRQP
jgi:predicted DNA-binding transcriptional regulator AlpA